MVVIEMKCRRAICGLSIMNRIRNDEARRRCGSKLRIGKRMDINVLMWYGHVERIEEEIVEKECIGPRFRVVDEVE
jgi:hypothetical protein